MAEGFIAEVTNGKVQGTCDPRFAQVADEFVKNFQERGEVGASVTIIHEGETVVDLWGGQADPAAGTPWEQDTITTCFSCTKGMVALSAHVLVSRGELDVEAPVSTYWPEFAKNGKEHATVRMMMDHSVGLPALRQPLKENGCCDWDYMIHALEEEEPFWKPGIRNGYHMINFGWTVGELVRRVSGKSLGAFYRDEIAGPTGAEFWIGLPEELEAKYAPTIAYARDAGEPLGEFEMALLSDPQSIQALSLLNNGGFNPNSRECHAAEIGGGGGVGNGRGLARAYAPFGHGGSWQGRQFVDETTLTRMGQVSMATNEDATLLIPSRFALGFMKSIDNRRRQRGGTDSAVLSAAAFGHVGAGGSIGFADPAARFSFGYAMNRMGKGILLNDRGQSLVDACYRSLGYSSNDGGVWVQ
ncbi:MAG: beta-lactamase family protein [Dehalococcoidia bacterium]|nr:beta-lactamase family protein [Dehalococcoidia bacterium]